VQVRSINVKEELAPDGRSPAEKLAAAKEELTMKVRKGVWGGGVVCCVVCVACVVIGLGGWQVR
jgi:hypothetical protein